MMTTGKKPPTGVDCRLRGPAAALNKETEHAFPLGPGSQQTKREGATWGDVGESHEGDTDVSVTGVGLSVDGRECLNG